MVKLKKISVSGFKSINKMDLELRQINVMIGQNGAGKSNLFSLFRLLRALMAVQLRDFVAVSGGAGAYLCCGAKTTPRFDVIAELEAQGATVKYAQHLAYAAGNALIVEHESIEFPAGERQGNRMEILAQGATESGVRGPSGETQHYADIVWDFFRQCRVLHLNDTSREARVRQPRDIHDNRWLHSDAGNLAAILYRTQQLQPKAYRVIVETIRQIMPWFGDFDLKPLELNKEQIRLDCREKGRDFPFGPHLLPDGAMRAMALITVLLQPKAYHPSLLLIDEPELGLHPAAMTVIASLIKGAAHHYQIILATQSPYFLDHFGAEDVVVVERSNGASTFNRLEPEKLREWLDEYSLGELWEKNVFGGGPF